MKKIIALLLLLVSCDFQMNDEEARKELSHASGIQFADLKTADRTIHYVFIDSNKPIMLVFIHGSPGSWNAFIDFFKADSLTNTYDLIAPDRPGFGQSGYGIPEPSLEKQAEYLKAVLDLFPAKKKILIGHSLGGPVAARMIMDYPDAFHGLILIAPSIDPNLEKDEWYRHAIRTTVGSWLTPKAFEVSNEEILPLKDELNKMLPLWRNIKVPVIVVQGEEDRLVPKENADFAAKMLPDSLLEVRMLKDVDHFIPWTHPEEIIKAIRDISNSL